ncbi:MAG: PEP/pyruvate-binding domain-containing protein [Thermodesulfobacteriota bacterium]|nr:PEP/pyruvate-binding domain-containing protein [Thermodesulfobacteriota bacterium]
MSVKSKALEVNLADYHVDVSIDPRYLVLREVMAKYHGLMERFDTFLKELSHPYKSRQFIVKEARTFALDYFHQLQKHEKGVVAARLYAAIFLSAVTSARELEVKTDAADNLLLFLRKITTSGDVKQFAPALTDAFEGIHRLSKDDFFVFVKSYYQLDNIAADIRKQVGDDADFDFTSLNRLLVDYYSSVYRYWQHEKDGLAWFQKEVEAEIQATAADMDHIKDIKAELVGISHNSISVLVSKLKQIERRNAPETAATCSQLLELPGYHYFVAVYRRLPNNLYNSGAPHNRGNRWKMLALFFIMNTPGLSTLHEESLRELNATLTYLIFRENIRKSRELLNRTFKILKEQTNRFPQTALNCVQNIGESVYRTDDTDLIKFFIDCVIDLGFHSPMVEGVDDDWKIKANHAHLQNIRTWLALVRMNPQKSSRLLSALIIHLSLSGVFIRDTDLFPRDITELLNSDIATVYNLVKQLTRQLPVFFNDIGAEGSLRDISTEIDEISNRKDVLVHFLRKQGHVEGSNRLIAFMEAVMSFWRTGDKICVRPYVPPEIYDRIESSGVHVDGMQRIFSFFADQGISLPRGLLGLSDERVEALCSEVPEVPDKDRRRAYLAVAFYKLLDQKYNVGFTEIDSYVDQLVNTGNFPDIGKLKDAFAETQPNKKASRLIGYLEQLKFLILSGEQFDIQQNIYEKRHIAVDIPSMYGSYHETKFDALGLTFRIEALLNVLFEEIVDNVDLSIITKTTFFQIYSCLKLFVRALAVDGFSTKELEIQLDLLSQGLKTRGFSFSQFLDIFKRFAKAVKNIITDHFHNKHAQNLSKIMSRLSASVILLKYLPSRQDNDAIDHEKLTHRVSEVFFREKIALSLGLTQLDLFLSRILNVLFHQSNTLPDEMLHKLLNYDPGRSIAQIDQAETKRYGIIHLGNKGLNMIRLKSYACPVPPGFIITTEVFKCREIINSYAPAEDIFRQQLSTHLRSVEAATGKTFGHPGNPLLLSVRSGASISQPGMMDTSLNVGINEEIAQGLAEQTQNAWFAWDNYRRFLQCYGMAFGLKRDDFDAVMKSHKAQTGVPLKKNFSGDQMRQIAIDYKKLIDDAGIKVVDDPFEQLYVTIRSVFDSWYSQKAETYRKIVGISDDWGTAVTVQTMVYGNISQQSGSGVFFTHSPRLSDDTIRLWGDFTVGNQGEDVVAGLVSTLPISEVQKETEQRKTNITLETHFPGIYNALKKWVEALIYEHGWNPQEIEFTFESPSEKDLYLLQTRDMTIRESRGLSVFDPEDVLSGEKFLGQGIGVGGGAMNGRIVFTLEEIDKWALAEPDTSLILVRGDTVPDDIQEISATDGLVTARGGLSSHAAVLAHSLGKTCVVGCGNLMCNEVERVCWFNNIQLASGDFISIDGSEGTVYRGRLKTKKY